MSTNAEEIAKLEADNAALLHALREVLIVTALLQTEQPYDQEVLFTATAIAHPESREIRLGTKIRPGEHLLRETVALRAVAGAAREYLIVHAHDQLKTLRTAIAAWEASNG